MIHKNLFKNWFEMGCYDTDLYFKKPSIKVLTWHFRERRVDSHAPGKG
jgi:hypothetical protein